MPEFHYEEIKKGAEPRRAAQIWVHKQVQRRGDGGLGFKDAHQIRVGLTEPHRQQGQSGTRLHAGKQSEQAAAARRYGCAGCHSLQPSCGTVIESCAIGRDDRVPADLLWSRRLAITVYIGAAGIDRPRHLPDLALNKRALALPLRQISICANGNISFAAREVERPVGHEQLYLNVRMLPPKSVNDRRHDCGCERFGTGHTNRATKPAVLKVNVTVEVIYGLFDLLGARAEFGPGSGKAITIRVTLDELTAKAFLQGRDPPMNRRLAHSETLRGAERTSCTGYREEGLEVIPVKCSTAIHFCPGTQQPCGVWCPARKASLHLIGAMGRKQTIP